MPELPEVEIHRRKLAEWLPGKRIQACSLRDPTVIGSGSAGAEALPTRLQGRRTARVERLAKYLLLRLAPEGVAGEETLVAHLRMTGRFVRDEYIAGEPGPPTRFSLHLEDGTRVRFEDRRRFGRIWLAASEQVGSLPELGHLGPDALLEPSSAERLSGLAARSRQPIKAFLMDQRRLGGLGNICAIEVLYRARIAPETPAGELAAGDWERIARLIPPYLEWAIDRQSRRTLLYIGEKGAENVFTIYRRAGEPCPACGTKIIRTVQAGRSAYSCPGCQPPRGVKATSPVPSTPDP